MVFEEIFSGFITTFLLVLPSVVLAIILMVVGYILGWLAKIALIKIVNYMGFDEWFGKQHLLAAIGNKSLSSIVGSILKWYIFFIFLKQSIELVNLLTLNEVLGFWISFVLLVIAALAILIIGLIFGRFARNAISATKYPLKKFIGLAVELMIVYVALVMGIRMIGLPAQLLEWTFLIAFAGIVLCASLMIGIGFGLSLKDEAKEVIKELKKKAN